MKTVMLDSATVHGGEAPIVTRPAPAVTWRTRFPGLITISILTVTPMGLSIYLILTM
jgi:hypothetical protein